MAVATENKVKTKNIILVGVGGQGILLASEISAQAAMNAGFRVKTNETHGMAQRGGSVTAHVRYGSDVSSPTVAEGEADVLGSLEKIEAIRFAHYLAPGALAVISKQAIVPVSVSSGASVYPEDADQRIEKVFNRYIYIDAIGIATEIGNIRAANVVILGAMSTALDLPVEAWREAVVKCVKPKFKDINIKAFEAGRLA
jgi:indolepyruvate ferredoxin oxidoreductase, beta subunit